MTGLADRVPVPVLVVDHDGVVVRSNDAAREYLGDAASVGADVTTAVRATDDDTVDALLGVGDVERGDARDDHDDHDADGDDDGDDEVHDDHHDVDGDGRERRVRFDVDERTNRPTVHGTPVADGVELVLDIVAERNQYCELVESVGDPMYVLDEAGYITTVNDALVDTYGYAREDLVGSHATMVIPEAAFERGTRKIFDILDGECETATIEFEVTRADGTTGWAEVNLGVLTDDDGAYSGSVGVTRDVTDRKQRARELADFETIAETAPVGMFTVDEDGVVTWANWRLYERLGMSQDELVGRPFYELLDEGFVEPEMLDRYTEYVRELLSDDSDVERADHEEVIHPLENETVDVEAHTALLPLGENGKFAGTVNAFRDITQRKAYREELERQNERLATFASVVSHDLRNPLNVASGHLELARNRHPEDESLAEVASSLSRMSELIDDILSLARQGETVSDPEPVDLGATAHQAWGTVDTGDATLDVRTNATIMGVHSRIQQLLENLFRNSVEHGSTSSRLEADDSVEHSSTGNRTQSGDSVEHGSTSRRTDADGGTDSDDDPDSNGEATSGREPGPITVTVESTDDGFVVTDDGPGLPADLDIFELGATTNDHGTGLGLAIVAEIVDAHGWAIEASDGPTGGARFVVTGVDVMAEGASE